MKSRRSDPDNRRPERTVFRCFLSKQGTPDGKAARSPREFFGDYSMEMI